MKEKRERQMVRVIEISREREYIEKGERVEKEMEKE